MGKTFPANTKLKCVCGHEQMTTKEGSPRCSKCGKTRWSVLKEFSELKSKIIPAVEMKKPVEKPIKKPVAKKAPVKKPKKTQDIPQKTETLQPQDTNVHTDKEDEEGVFGWW